MGADQQRMMKLLLAIALVACASALPSPDTTVPEVQMTQMVATAAKAAKETVSSMLEAGSSDSACAELAATTISEVEDAVKAQQEAIDKFAAPNDGTSCLEEGKAEVDSATEALDAAKKASEDAAAESAAAAGASVDFGPVSLSALTEDGSAVCGPWASDAAFTSAKAAAAAGASKASEAAAAIGGFEEALTAATDAAAKAVKECECKVYTDYTAAFETAESHKETNEASYTKGKHMQCVLAGTAPDACDAGTTPAVTPITLAAGATADKCPEAEAPAEGTPVGAEPGRDYPDGGDFGPSSGSSKLCVYTAPTNVDFASGSSSEGPAVLADLRGYLDNGDARLTEMPNIAEISSKCAPASTMVIPECERSPITAETAAHMKTFVEGGGTIIFTEMTPSHVTTAINVISGGTLNWAQGSNSVAQKKTTSARFSECPDTLPSLNGGAAITKASFGEGANVLYESSSGDVLVGQVRIGAGQVWWLGFDWYEGDLSAGGGGVRDGWAKTLAAAVGKQA